MERGLQYVFDFAPQAVHYHCVEKHLSRAFSNLISNAIRYAKKIITLTCQQNGKEITVIVRDDGPGIPTKDLPFIFDRFYSGKGGKHGIGLAIVKTVIEQHHGTIKAQSDSSGSTFKVIFNQQEQ